MQICFYSQYENLIPYLDFWNVHIARSLSNVFDQNYDLLIVDTNRMTENACKILTCPVIGLTENLQNTDFLYRFDRVLATPCNPIYLAFSINHLFNHKKITNLNTIAGPTTILNQIPRIQSVQSIHTIEQLYGRTLQLHDKAMNNYILQSIAIISELHIGGNKIWTEQSNSGRWTIHIDSTNLTGNSIYSELATIYGIHKIQDSYCTHSIYSLGMTDTK